MKIYKNKSAFSIIEILVGMFIFSMWIISIYALISSSVRVNEYNKNYIIASNLAREQLELLRNNRDYNYEKLQKFDQINPPLTNQDNIQDNYSNILNSDTYYKIQNNIAVTANFPISIEEILGEDFVDDSNYQLCLDEKNMYVYCDSLNWEDQKETVFFKYVYIDKSLWEDQLKITSKVIWKSRWIHEFEVKTILSDWKQL